MSACARGVHDRVGVGVMMKPVVEESKAGVSHKYTCVVNLCCANHMAQHGLACQHAALAHLRASQQPRHTSFRPGPRPRPLSPLLAPNPPHPTPTPPHPAPRQPLHAPLCAIMAPVTQPAMTGLAASCLARHFSTTHSLKENSAPITAKPLA